MIHRTLIVPALIGAVAAASQPRGQARVGDIEVVDAYIPQPASPDVAVAYFTLRDTGPTGDELMSASTLPASQTMVMREVAAGANTGSMYAVTGGLTVPARGGVTLAPGGYHLMLSNPKATLVAGDHVTITLRLKHAGAVSVVVPVTSLLSDAQTSSASMAPMPGM